MAVVVEMVNVLLPDPGDLMLVGDKFADIPDGFPLTLRLMADLNVEEIAVETESVVLLPTRIVAVLTDVAIVNVAGTETTKLTAEVMLVPPEVPRTMSG